MITTGRCYEAFAEEFPFCMACGWSLSEGPRHWHFPKIDTHHIVLANRVKDRRAVIRLCECCHRLAHGMVIRIEGEPLPTLTQAHCKWIKMNQDPEYYDPAYLDMIKGRKLERAYKPPKWHLDQMEMRRVG